MDISADERYVAKLDGRIVSRGPHRGIIEHWNYQTYRILPSPGKHVLEVSVARLGRYRPFSQVSWRGGFVLKASGMYDRQLTTGKAEWQSAVLTGTSCWESNISRTNGQVGWPFKVKGASWTDEQPTAYTGVRVVKPRVKEMIYGTRADGWMLFPTGLPDQMERVCSPGHIRWVSAGDVAKFDAVLTKGETVEVPPGTSVELLWDLGDYFCAYPEMTVSDGKGSEIEWLWDESLRDGNGNKGDRSAFEGKSMTSGFGDRFYPDGGVVSRFSVPWWRSGRWCRISVKTADRPLRIKRLEIRETRYAISGDSKFKCDDAAMNDIAGICRRTMECCMHETLLDCPHWEQAMYAGDSRVELNILSALTSDDRMRRNVLSMFDWSRRNDGLVPMVTPLSGGKDSSTYTMYWIMMFGDYVEWGTDENWLKAHVPGMRAALDGLSLYEDADGLLRDLPGWNYVDHVCWPNGVPPGGRRGESPGCVINLLYLAALQSAAVAENAVHNEIMARRWSEKAERLALVIKDRYYDSDRGCLAERNMAAGCVHAVCLGVLTGVLSHRDYHRVAEMLSSLNRGHSMKMGAHFKYYLFNAMFKIGRPDLFWSELNMWRKMVGSGLCTTTETGGIEARSDCHAWSASPLLFFHTGVAGVRPAGCFWSAVRIVPQPGELKQVFSVTPTPKGAITVDLQFDGDNVRGVITVPPALPCEFVWRGRVIPLKEGSNSVER